MMISHVPLFLFIARFRLTDFVFAGRFLSFVACLMPSVLQKASPCVSEVH